MKIKVEAKTVKPKNKRLEGGGRKPPDLQFVNQLVEWIYDRRSNGLSVSKKLIMAKAKYFYESECDESEKSFFVASIIMRCNSFSLRRKTTMAKQDPEQLIDKLILYILPARRLSIKCKYPLSSIMEIDETSVWNDMAPNTTIDK